MGTGEVFSIITQALSTEKAKVPGVEDMWKNRRKDVESGDFRVEKRVRWCYNPIMQAERGFQQSLAVF